MTDATLLAGVITEALLSLQAQAVLGAIPREMAQGENLRAQVHQASGMISEQLDIEVRAHAYAEGRPINAVAADVVARVLRIP